MTRSAGKLRTKANFRILFIGCKRSIDDYLGGSIGKRAAKRKKCS